MAAVQGRLPAVAARQPAEERGEPQDMHGRRVKLGRTVREPDVATPPLLGCGHHAGDLGDQRAVLARCRFDLDGAAQIDGAGIEAVVTTDMAGAALARDQAFVDLAVTDAQARVHRNALAGSDEDAHARLDGARRDALGGPVGVEHGGSGDAGAKQVLSGSSGAGPHAAVEDAADQQEEQQRDRGVEIDVIEATGRLVEAHAGGEQHAERDRHVHVEAAGDQRAAWPRRRTGVRHRRRPEWRSGPTANGRA